MSSLMLTVIFVLWLSGAILLRAFLSTEEDLSRGIRYHIMIVFWFAVVIVSTIRAVFK